ncbi:RNA-directed DNA polymerase, eukaryota, reverse transcriptase zinc-binding domain protein, partial [Tanacetum coccineum]
ILLDDSLGGLGVCSISAKNLGLLAKWKWRLLTETNSIWRIVIKCFYGDEGGFGSLTVLARCKGVWSDIVKAVLSIETLVPAFKNSFQVESLQRVEHLILERPLGGNWSWRLAPQGRAISELNTLISLIGNYALDDNRDDSWSWSRDVSGIFKVKPLATHVQNSLISDCVLGEHHKWNSLVSRKINICVWRASLNRLPSRLNLISRRVSLPSPRCPFCDVENEEIEHCLIKCPTVVPVWSWWGLATPTYFPSFYIALGNVGSPSCAKTHKVLQWVFLCAIWSIWKWRNKVVNAKQESIDGVKKEDIFPFVQRSQMIGFRPDATRPFPIGVAGFLSLLRYFYSCGLVLVFVSRLIVYLRVCPLLYILFVVSF